MASAASPSAADPKMTDLYSHTAQISSSRACAEDGYFKCPIPLNIDGDIWSDMGWYFCWVLGGRTSDTQLARRKLVKKIHPDHGGRRRPAAAMVPPPRRRDIPQAAHILRSKLMSLKLGLSIVININLTIHRGASASVVGCVLFFST